MTTDAKSFYEEWPSRMTHAKDAAPQVARGFGTLYQSVMKNGALDVREKELIAIGIGMALRCEGCIYTHVEKAIKAGASREQIMEAAGVAVMMQGGPTYTYLPTIVEALDTIQDEHTPQSTSQKAGQPA